MLREGVIFNPEELSLLGGVFDQVFASLPRTMQTRANRAEIAKNILAAAATGERGPIELERAATMNLAAAIQPAPNRDRPSRYAATRSLPPPYAPRRHAQLAGT